MVQGGAVEQPVPLFRTTDEPDLGRTLEDRAADRRDGRFAGALVGVIALGEANVIAPSLHDNLPRETDAVLVDESGEIVYPTDRARAADGSDWEPRHRARRRAAARAR